MQLYCASVPGYHHQTPVKQWCADVFRWYGSKIFLYDGRCSVPFLELFLGNSTVKFGISQMYFRRSLAILQPALAGTDSKQTHRALQDIAHREEERAAKVNGSTSFSPLRGIHLISTQITRRFSVVFRC
eukprot:1393530-Rhodomonas_salina.2